MNNLADLYKKFMADVCAKFECSDMYKPLEQGFRTLCESYYDYDYDYDPPDYDPPGPWDDADSRTITIPFISGNPDGNLFELDEDSGDVYISFNIEAWFKLAGVTDIVPEDLSADLESEEIADAATQYTVSWDSPSQFKMVSPLRGWDGVFATVKAYFKSFTNFWFGKVYPVVNK